MILLRQIFNFIKMLHTENSTNQLCAGFVMGMFMGFTPMMTLHWFGYLVVILILRINMGAAFLSYALFKILSFALDPLFGTVGLYVLSDLSFLTGFWTALYHSPIVPFTRFNNSIVMGSFLLACLLAVPFFFLSKRLVIKYRQVVVNRVRASFLWKSLTATKVYRLYDKYQQIKNA